MAHIPSNSLAPPWSPPLDPREVIRREDEERLARMRVERLAQPTADAILRRTALFARGGR